MATLTLRARGNRNVDDAWERYAAPARWPEWSPQITSVTATSDRLAVGVTGHVRSFAGVSIPFEVTAFDEFARSWSWQVGWPPLAVELHHVVGRHGTGSETSLQLSRRAAVLAVPYLPLAQVALQRLVR